MLAHSLWHADLSSVWPDADPLLQRDGCAGGGAAKAITVKSISGGQRFIEVWSGMLTLFLIILLSSVVQPNSGGCWQLLSCLAGMSLVGVAGGSFYVPVISLHPRGAGAWRQRSQYHPASYVAKCHGRYLTLPFILCSSITTLTSLDFGFGLPLGSPSLGELLLGKNNLQAPWLGITAFLIGGDIVVFAGSYW